MTTDHRRIRSRGSRAGALTAATVLLVSIVAACGDDDGASAAASTTVTTTDPPGTTASGGDAAVRLADAVAAVGTQYAFTSTVTAGGVEVTSVEGVLYGDTGSYVVHSGGATVEYIVAPTGRWIREPLGEWLPLQESAPVMAPLAVLSTPISVDTLSGSGDLLVLAAIYDGASLGFTDGEVEVHITLIDGVLTEIAYEVSLGEGQGTAEVVTVIDAEADVQPITLPGG